jgi:aryl-alcohol dehydrogenase
MNITAAVAREPKGPFAFEQLVLDRPREHEVVVAIRGMGLCHTDLAARDGVFGLPYPLVLGHEGSGVVVDVGSAVTKVRPGDHVALSFNSCGECPSCAKGDPAYCHQFPAYNYGGARPDGSSPLQSAAGPITGNFFGQSSFATHAMANERNVVKVDDDLPLELVGTLGCGIQTGAGAIMKSLACRPGSSILILGAGPVGLAAVMGAVIQGCEQILVSEPHAARRELAISLGATHALDPGAGELAEEVRAIVPGVDYVFDTTGNVQVVEAALGCLAHRGVLGLVGVPHDFAATLAFPIIQSMVLGLTVTGITEGDSNPDEFIPELLRLYREGRFPFDRMIGRTYPFSQLNEAVEAQLRGDAIKVVLVNDESEAAR